MTRRIIPGLAPIPQWLIDHFGLRANGENSRSNREPILAGEIIPGPGPDGSGGKRDRTLTRMAGSMRHAGFDEDAIYSALCVTNSARCDPPLEDAAVRKIARSIGKKEPDGMAGVTLNLGQSETAQPVVSLMSRYLKKIEVTMHDELLDADLPPPSWVVDGLLMDEGLTFIGGKKKLGKSWLCLQMAQAVARGVDCLGRRTTQGPVIYICLEDGRRRVKQRLQKQQTQRGLDIAYYTRFPPLDGDGMNQLMELIDTRKPRLVLIDTLAAAKTGKTEENAAGPMADLANTLRVIGQHFKTGLGVTHHHGKGVGGDPGDDLRGSSALSGAADVNLGIYKEEGHYLLRGEGRDIGEFSYRVEFDVERWSWSIVGDARDAAKAEAETAIVEAVRELGEASAHQVAEALGKDRGHCSRILTRLTGQQKLICREELTGKSSRILYRAPLAP